MAIRRKLAVLVSTIVLLLVAFVLWSNFRSVSVTSLAVPFIGLTNNPARQWTPTRIELCQGATGLCGMFVATNITSDRWIWFKTVGVEQKTKEGWQTFVPSGKWSGVEGGRWSPGYGCLYAVGWPPGLSTNATWRLRVSYGYEPSLFRMFLNRKIGREIFHSSGEEAVISSAEVSQ